MNAGYEVAIESLYNDSKRWLGISDTLNIAQVTAETLTFQDIDWPTPVYLTGLPRIYEQLRSRMSTLLSEGAEATEHLASTLREVALDYERSDTAASTEYRGIWEPN